MEPAAAPTARAQQACLLHDATFEVGHALLRRLLPSATGLSGPTEQGQRVGVLGGAAASLTSQKARRDCRSREEPGAWNVVLFVTLRNAGPGGRGAGPARVG